MKTDYKKSYEKRLYKRMREDLGMRSKDAIQAISGLRTIQDQGWEYTWEDDYDEDDGEKRNHIVVLDDDGEVLGEDWEYTFSDIGQAATAGLIAHAVAAELDVRANKTKRVKNQMRKYAQEKSAKEYAKEKGLAYGFSVFSSGWFVGTSEELKRIGVVDIKSNPRASNPTAPFATALFAVKKGDEDWEEQLITEQPEHFEEAKKWAIANGFHRFRVVTVSGMPDFGANLLARGQKKQTSARKRAKKRARNPDKAKRYIGDAIVHIAYQDDDTYAGKIHAGGKVWKFDELRGPRAGFPFASDSAEAYDKMAQSAVSFGSYYSSGNRGDDVPDWAPKPEVADAIDEAVSWAQDDQGNYEVRRRKTVSNTERLKNSLLAY